MVRRLLRFLAGLFRPRLPMLLAVLRQAGVREFRRGELHVVFRDDLEGSRATPGATEAIEAAMEPPGRGDGPPTSDELLFGVDGYGMGPPPGGDA